MNIDLSAVPYDRICQEHEAISAEFEAAIESNTSLRRDRWELLGAYQQEHAVRLARRDRTAAGPVGISWINEYGMKQKLSATVLCF